MCAGIVAALQVLILSINCSCRILCHNGLNLLKLKNVVLKSNSCVHTANNLNTQKLICKVNWGRSRLSHFGEIDFFFSSYITILVLYYFVMMSALFITPIYTDDLQITYIISSGANALISTTIYALSSGDQYCNFCCCLIYFCSLNKCHRHLG